MTTFITLYEASNPVSASLLGVYPGELFEMAKDGIGTALISNSARGIFRRVPLSWLSPVKVRPGDTVWVKSTVSGLEDVGPVVAIEAPAKLVAVLLSGNAYWYRAEEIIQKETE